MSTIKDAIREAANGFAVLPAEFTNLMIKDNIPDRDDWEEFNSRLCAVLKTKGCTIVEGQLNPFWERNDTFSQLIIYIDNRCGF
jgi:hypothetical protein